MQDTKVLHLGRVQIVPPSFFTPDFASVVQLQFFKLRHVLFLKKLRHVFSWVKGVDRLSWCSFLLMLMLNPVNCFFYVNRFTHVTNKWESWWVVASETLESLVFGNPYEVWVYCPLQLAFFWFQKKSRRVWAFAHILRICSRMAELSQQSQNNLKFGSERINKYEAT
jgi:hypothetical protein